MACGPEAPEWRRASVPNVRPNRPVNPFHTVVLQSARLELRPVQPPEAAGLYAVFSDPEVMRYWSTPPWTSLAQAEQRIQADLDGMAAGEHMRLGLFRRTDATLLGVCSMFAFVPSCRRAEVGYALARPAWGQGYAQEAMGAFIDHGFGALGLNRLEADIDPRNAASARLLERLGFRREGLLRERWIVGDEVSDSALYGLLQREWAGRSAAARGQA